MAVFAIASAIVGGAASFFGAKSRNKGVQAAAEIQGQQINAAVTRNRVRGILTQHSLSAAGRKAIDSTRVAASLLGPSQSRDLALAQDASQLVASASAVDQQIEDEEDTLELQKDALRVGANNQMVNPALTAVGGAIQGYQMGAALDANLAQAKHLDKLSEFEAKMRPLKLERERVGIIFTEARTARVNAEREAIQRRADERVANLNSLRRVTGVTNNLLSRPELIAAFSGRQT